ncbi:interleukin-17 receptor C [Scomber scombrus]|uniref:interleukin-17 receptor C n=1 Tax=Scomber scombrus TaxID=13677 RepID=UPI002DD885D4|nr:interleukin-17 receptor C [Scomber scombrus]
MFPLGWLSWCLFLTLCMSTCGLEITDYDGNGVICIQALSECTLWDGALMPDPDDAVDVQNLRPKFKLCCKELAECTLCLVIDAELYIHPDNKTESEDHSGNDEEDYSDPKVSVTICYKAAQTMPLCKRVEFTVNHAALTQSNLAQVSMVINKPVGVYFGSQLFVYSSDGVSQEVVVPSHEEVCSQQPQKYTEECYVPTLIHVINYTMNRVELQFAGRNLSLHSVCAQNEDNGRCQILNRMTIPLYSVTPCMCLQAWREDGHQRIKSCPFAGKFEENMWQNVSLSVSKGQMNNEGTMLLWNLSAPCRLKGEVWPCHWPADLTKEHCSEIKGFRQQLENSTWKQNTKGLWEKTEVFEDIDLELSPCVMVKVEGNGPKLGPICYKDTGRWRWSLLVVAVVLPACLTALLYYFLRDFVKRWVWSWHHKGFVEVGRKGHVVLLSPPDVDYNVSESVCGLGTLLSNQGFSVSVDQWSRKEQCTLGPLPWLYSQLLELNRLGGRVVLVLTRKALERAEEWTNKHKEVDNDLPQVLSPYSDVFTASLSLIQADNQLGRAGERFLLVKFDSFAVHPLKGLPKLLQGIPLFQFPSQTEALFSELTVG